MNFSKTDPPADFLTSGPTDKGINVCLKTIEMCRGYLF